MWIEVAQFETLADDAPRAVRIEGRRLVVGKLADGSVFALDGLCPHEGYPLASGSVRDGRLTCAWHNWKFDVRDGACVLGGEGVRAWPARVREGVVEVDLTPPDPRVEAEKGFASLTTGLVDNDLGRSLRDAVRLLVAEVPAERILLAVARHDAQYGEYGTTHVLPLAADCARFLPEGGGPDAITALVPVIEICGETHLRLERRPVAPAKEVDRDGGREHLRRSIEEEQVDESEAIVRGAFAAGVTWQDVERWLSASVSDHFTGFGHSLIYLVKGHELLERVAGEGAEDLLVAQAISLAQTTREDELPYLRPYFDRFARLASEAESFDRSDLVQAALDGTIDESCRSLLAAIHGGESTGSIAARLVLAAAHRLLRFDPAHDADPDVAEGWLWASHRLTFAAAVRHAVARYDDECGRRLLYQALAFVHSGRAMDAAAEWRSDAAVPIEDTRAFRQRLLEDALGTHWVRPIFVAHAIKTAVAAVEEFEAAADGEAALVLLHATRRFLDATPFERSTPAQALRAKRFVVDGEIPRKLTQ